MAASSSSLSDLVVGQWCQLLGLKTEKAAIARALHGDEVPPAWMCEEFLVGWRSDEGDTVIHQLVKKGWSKLLRILFLRVSSLRSILSVPTRDHGLNAFHLTCMSGDVKTCKVLLRTEAAKLLPCYSMKNQRPTDLLGPGRTAAKLASLLRKREAEELAAFQSRDETEIWSLAHIKDLTTAAASTAACTQEHPLLDLWGCSGPWPADWHERVVSDVYSQRTAAHKQRPLTYGLVVGSPVMAEFCRWLLHDSPLLAPFRAASPAYSPSLTSVDITAIFASTAAQETGAVDGHQDQSVVTINLCLQTLQLAGGTLVFTQGELAHSVEQQQGRLLVHSGVLKHSVEPVRHGKRMNIIVWYRSS